ncbi:MAG: GTPase Era [Deltaproteobacteria bacterium]|nr:GTPase Era [Deltaproteobacteria bacterium]
MSFKSGFVSIIGSPNVGKSTLLNTILGEKIAIISSKPQTTRNKITGIKNLKDSQIIFLDTPGIHRTKKKLNLMMVKQSLSALKDVDVIIYMVEATRQIDNRERYIIDNLKTVKSPVILCINKVDLVKKDTLLPLITEFERLYKFIEIVPISCRGSDGIDRLLNIVVSLLPEGPKYFPDDMVTDLPERFITAEIIREKIFELTKEEIPYSTAVYVEEFKEDLQKNLVTIRAAINVERNSQKGILIGKNGSMLKEIGTRARIDIEGLLGARVFLKLFVRVQEGWTEDKRTLKEFGYY